jgi:hypothetical protein
MYAAITACGCVLGVGQYPDCARSDVTPALRYAIALIARASCEVIACWDSGMDVDVELVNGVAVLAGSASNQIRIV